MATTNSYEVNLRKELSDWSCERMTLPQNLTTEEILKFIEKRYILWRK